MKRLALLCVLALALPSCGGGAMPGGPQLANPARATSPNDAPARRGKKVRVKVRVHVPRPNRHMKSALYRRLSVASATQGIRANVFAHGSSTLLSSTDADISPTSGNCTTTGTTRNCTFDIAAPPGDDDFVFKTYDEAPAGGTIPSGANQLGAGVANQTIVEGTANGPISVTLGGVVASIQLAVTPIAWHTLIVANATLQVFAQDAGGNAVVGSYVDASGNPISISLSISNSGCCPAISFTPSSLSSPSTTGVALSYNGNLANQGGVQTITASPSGGPSANGTTTINLVDPNFNHVFDGNLNAEGPFFDGIAMTTPNDVVYSFNTGSGGVGDYNIPGGTIVDTTAPAANPVNGGIGIFGANYYIAGPNNLYTFAPLGAAPGCASVSCTGGSGSGMAVDANGDVWYGNGTSIVEYNGTTSTSYPAGGTPAFGMSFDQTPAKNLWYANSSAGHNLLEFNTTTHVATPFTLPSSNARPFDVITDAAGMIWVTDRSANQIVEIDPSGPTVVNTYYTLYGSPWYIVQDPVQLTTYWFSFQNGYNAGVGRLDTLTGTVTQASDYSYSAQPGALLENNGLIYMVLDGSSNLDVVTP